MNTDQLFEKTNISGMTLNNRFVRSATWEGLAGDDGSVTPELTSLMVELAKGGVGLIISSHAYVSREGQAGSRQLGIYDDGLVPGLSKMTAAVHDNQGSIVAQIAHAGLHAFHKLTGQTPLAPSAVEGLSRAPCRAMDDNDITRVVDAFAAAAYRAREAGFDGVQIHAAHGYLLSQFLSPVYNQRTDDLGGTVENRARMLLMVLEAVRNRVGSDYPVLVKMNSGDFREGGLHAEDAASVAEMLEQGGIDAIEVSGGLIINRKLSPSRMGIHSADKEAYFETEAGTIRGKTSVPLILVGGNRSLEVAARIVSEGVADYISMSRPFIREPGLVKRWQSGDHAKATCLSDNKCFGPAMAGRGIYCVVERGEDGGRSR
ncbi:MAG: NADH:flavin oxidoreductase [Deltaproteobacteria bacterium]|jgi:2,4-dienoyl-CoA reductase-like NADH-dependent reductase (Old Yellow Enzyme family)|nr:NADH:flavin oxidoreductase [Deltaproteobacteria bacterium]